MLSCGCCKYEYTPSTYTPAWLLAMSGGGYWTDLVTGFEGARSLDEFSFPMTQETQPYEVLHVGASPEEDEVQAAAGDEVVEVMSSAGGNKRPRVPRPNAKRQKNFIPDEDEIVVSAWLNVSKDPVQGLEMDDCLHVMATRSQGDHGWLRGDHGRRSRLAACT